MEQPVETTDEPLASDFQNEYEEEDDVDAYDEQCIEESADEGFDPRFTMPALDSGTQRIAVTDLMCSERYYSTQVDYLRTEIACVGKFTLVIKHTLTPLD